MDREKVLTRYNSFVKEKKKNCDKLSSKESSFNYLIMAINKK